MHPYFYSLQEFLAMGKHGVYVWSSWGIVVMAVMVFSAYSVQQRRQLIQSLNMQQARQQHRKPDQVLNKPR